MDYWIIGLHKPYANNPSIHESINPVIHHSCFPQNIIPILQGRYAA
jgi:hypothetical protein